MRILILYTDYPEFLRWLYSQNPGLEKCSYKEQLQRRMDNLCGTADFYSSNLQKLGCEAYDIIPNNEILQKQWAKENGLAVSGKKGIYRTVYQIGKRTIKSIFPFLKPGLKSLFPAYTFPGFYQILSDQIKQIHPDVILNQATDAISSHFLAKMKSYYKLLVGQIASSLPKDENFKSYNLIISSLPNLVGYFQNSGIKSENLGLGFELKILEQLGKRNPTISVSHIGGYGSIHSERNSFLEKVSKKANIDFWGYGIENIKRNSPISQYYHGEAWGLKMYQILQDSKITINKHITSIAGSYANNMRLYEATGAGTLLITDYKDNLPELFIPGKEVVIYHSPEECIELIKYYLAHNEEREEIAKAGQERTLKEHTYYQRMQELIKIIKKYL